MASSESMECLKKTRAALKDIQTQLLPFLRDLGVDASSATAEEDPTTTNTGGKARQQTSAQKMIQASMAVALAMGTLRYMGARLRGLDQGRKSDDPLRQELNTMRKRMVALQKKLDASKEHTKKDESSLKRKTAAEDKDAKEEEEGSPEPAAKRRKGRRS